MKVITSLKSDAPPCGSKVGAKYPALSAVGAKYSALQIAIIEGRSWIAEQLIEKKFCNIDYVSEVIDSLCMGWYEVPIVRNFNGGQDLTSTVYCICLQDGHTALTLALEQKHTLFRVELDMHGVDTTLHSYVTLPTGEEGQIIRIRGGTKNSSSFGASGPKYSGLGRHGGLSARNSGRGELGGNSARDSGRGGPGAGGEREPGIAGAVGSFDIMLNDSKSNFAIMICKAWAAKQRERLVSVIMAVSLFGNRLMLLMAASCLMLLLERPQRRRSQTQVP